MTDALKRCEEIGLAPLCAYLTMGAKENWEKYRIVFDMGEPVTDEERALAITEQLLITFPEADQGCRKPNRLFYGSGGSVKEAWRVSADGE